jgi:hypothetical protein
MRKHGSPEPVIPTSSLSDRSDKDHPHSDPSSISVQPLAEDKISHLIEHSTGHRTAKYRPSAVSHHSNIFPFCLLAARRKCNRVSPSRSFSFLLSLLSYPPSFSLIGLPLPVDPYSDIPITHPLSSSPPRDPRKGLSSQRSLPGSRGAPLKETLRLSTCRERHLETTFSAAHRLGERFCYSVWLDPQYQQLL